MSDCTSECGEPYIPSRIYERIDSPYNPFVTNSIKPSTQAEEHSNKEISQSMDIFNLTKSQYLKNNLKLLLFLLCLVYLFK